MKPDRVVGEAGKSRGVAAAALDGTAGAWGNGDLLCVTRNGSGELIISAAVGDAVGVIWTQEGRQPTQHLTSAASKDVVGGKRYTVFTGIAEFALEAGATSTGVTALAAGDELYSNGDGTCTTTPAAGAIYIGYVDADAERLIINVNGRPTG